MENLKKSFLVRGNNIVGFSDKKNFSTAPLGTVLSFAGQTRPNGYLLCDGASYKVTDYPDLYAVIGNTYGGDSTNFNVPNLVDASQSPAPTMIYIIKAFHTNEGVDSDAGSGEENKIDSISVNGSLISIDENKNVDIIVPDAYDDTALVQRVSNIESNYAKTTEIPSKVSQLENDSNYLSSIPEEYVTETELEAKGYLTEHQDLSDYATKDEIPTVPSKVSELTNDSNYQTAEQVNSTVTTEIAKVVANAPEDFDTLKEMSDWIAGHENDVSAMNSAISDNKTNIETLQTDVANINTSLGGKLDKTFTGTDVANKILSTDGDGNVVLKDGNEDDTMLKSVYDTDDDGIVDKADSANIATNATDATNAENLKLSDGTIVNADTINTKLSKLDTTDNLSVELARKIDKPASATDGQVLTYNATSGEWEAKDSQGGGSAKEISYDNSTSGLVATNIQDAIDEISSNFSQISGGLNWTKIGESTERINELGTDLITLTDSLNNYKGIAMVLLYNKVLAAPAVLPIDVLLSTEQKRMSTRFGNNEVNAEYAYLTPTTGTICLAVNANHTGKVLLFGVK